MWRALLCALLLSGLLTSAVAQDAPDKPPPKGDGAQKGRPDGSSPEALARLTEVETQLKDKPDDKALVTAYVQSLRGYVNSAARSAQRSAGREPAEAVRRFRLAETALQRIPEGIADADAGREFDKLRRTVAEAAEKLARILKHDELVGAKAAPLQVEQWVSGTPLTEKDLSGKVVLLDFFAVWCRPNIETFPELAKWRKKHGDKLAIVGLTKYYDYQWDERTQGPREAASGDVPPQTEREMLEKFAKRHDLKHSLGTLADAELLDFYGVTTVPQIVVIDQEGIIRLIRAGGQSENVAEVAAMLDKLLGEPAADDGTK